MAEEKEEPEQFDFRSDDISEILGTPPSWLVRWGTSIIFAVFALLLLASWIIRYPDVIVARVVFTTMTPPVDVIARSEGHIQHLFVRENVFVKENEVLAILQNTADFEDMMALEKKLQAWGRISVADSLLFIPPLPGSPELGLVRNEYAAFVQQLEAYRFGKGNKSGATNANVGAVQQQISQTERSIGVELNNQRKAATQLQTARESLLRQKKLLDEGLISRNAYEGEESRTIEIEKQYNTYTEAVLRKKSEISNLQRSIGIVRLDDQLDINSSAGRLKAALSSLRSAFDNWKQNYLLVAPVDGQVSLNKFYAAQQYVQQGEQVMTIVPPADTKIIGRSMVPIMGSGKIEPKQEVIIRLDNYPYYEYGTLKGVVLSKSSVPKDNSYAVTLGLDSVTGVVTNFNRPIQFQQQLQGEAHIVTTNRRFLERIVDQLFASAR